MWAVGVCSGRFDEGRRISNRARGHRQAGQHVNGLQMACKRVKGLQKACKRLANGLQVSFGTGQG